MTSLPDLTQLLRPGVRGFASAMPVTGWTLHEFERRAVASAIERRVAEFTAGRYCAHQALRNLGVSTVAIPSGADRAPAWPEGIIGSISHSKTCSVAIVAYASDDLLSLGVDVEECEPVEDDLVRRIGLQQEYDLLCALECPSSAVAARLLFSMKEAVFKCLFPRFGEILEFEDLRLLVVDAKRHFTMARLQQDTQAVGVRVHGSFAVTPQFICCTAALYRSDLLWGHSECQDGTSMSTPE